MGTSRRPPQVQSQGLVLLRSGVAALAFPALPGPGGVEPRMPEVRVDLREGFVMARLPLESGGFAEVDDKNFDLLRHFTWKKCGFCGHVFRTVRMKLTEGEGDFTIYMASEVIGDETLPVEGACNPCPAVRD